MQVNVYGVISFGSRASYNDPRPFPLSASDKIIAPFNDEYDEYNYDYDAYEIAYHEQDLVLFRLSNNQVLLNEIGSTINYTLEVDFTPTMLFIVTWNGVQDNGSRQIKV